MEVDFKQAVQPPPPCSASSSHSTCHLTNNDSFQSRVVRKDRPPRTPSSPPSKARGETRSKRTENYQKEIKNKLKNMKTVNISLLQSNGQVMSDLEKWLIFATYKHPWARDDKLLKLNFSNKRAQASWSMLKCDRIIQALCHPLECCLLPLKSRNPHQKTPPIKLKPFSSFSTVKTWSV